jgi:release factor glutamine methyltransferase
MTQSAGNAGAEDIFRPSEYTAALLRHLRLRGPCTGRVLEIGTGSGVVLATLAHQGARELVGVDLEPQAVDRTRALLRSQGIAHASIRLGNLWQPVAGESFDLIVFNPPQSPLRAPIDDGRKPTWCHAGPDGRQVVDPFLRGLGRHLRPGGLVVMTHNGLIGMERSAELLHAQGLQLRVAQTGSVLLPPAKLLALPPQVRQRALGHSLHGVDPYLFVDVHIVEIRHGHSTGA